MRYFIGIDNSSLEHKVRAIDENGNKKFDFTIENNLNGFMELHNKIKNFEDLLIGFELPHGPLVDYLHFKNYVLYSLNPLKIKRYKESQKVSGNKNDDIDAIAIAEYLRTNNSILRQLELNSPEIETLKTLSIIHTRLTNNKTRHINKLHFVVRQYFPLHESLFSNFGCKIQLKMLKKYPTFKDLKQATDGEIKEFLVKNKYRRNCLIEKLIKKIRNYDQLISSEVEYSYQFEMLCLCSIIENLTESTTSIVKKMNQITTNHYLGKYFKSLPGAGPVLACELLALFGDNKDRFNNYNGAQCLFGTAPKNYQSGNYHKVLMRKACNKSARAVLYKFAFTSIKHCSWAREYYDKQRSRGKSNSVAIRALSNKWVKIIYKLWKDELFYDDTKKILAAA